MRKRKSNLNENLIRLLKVPDDAIYISHPRWKSPGQGGFNATIERESYSDWDNQNEVLGSILSWNRISNMHELPKRDYKLLGVTKWRASWCDSHNAYTPEPIWWSCGSFCRFNLTWRDEKNCVVAALNKIQEMFPLLEDLSHMAISHETMIFI